MLLKNIKKIFHSTNLDICILKNEKKYCCILGKNQKKSSFYFFLEKKHCQETRYKDHQKIDILWEERKKPKIFNFLSQKISHPNLKIKICFKKELLLPFIITKEPSLNKKMINSILQICKARQLYFSIIRQKNGYVIFASRHRVQSL